MSVNKQVGMMKKARQLLMSAEGREALKHFGIHVEIQDDKKQAEQPIIVILSPTYRSPEPMMTGSLNKAIEHARANDIIVYGGPPMQASAIQVARNAMITEQLKSGKPWTHALMVDDDMVVPEDSITKLLSHKKDIIGGLCTRRQDPPIPNIKFFDSERKIFEQIWEWPTDRMFEVGGIGTGFILLTRHAIEQVGQAYFDCLWEKDFYGVSDEWIKVNSERRLKHFDETKAAMWFRFIPSFTHAVEVGEDMAFCMIARLYCDLKVYCDSSVQPGHIGKYDYGIKDFVPYQKLVIERAKQEGNYRNETLVPEGQVKHGFHMTFEDSAA